MKKANKTMAGKGLLIGLIALICISNIAAFAISSDYWNGYPLRLAPGETKEFSIILQNLVGTSDIKLKAIVTTGSSILRLADSNDLYIVPAGEKMNVNFIATAPLDSEPGQVYNVKIDFSEVTEGSSGEFKLGTAIGQGFDVVILPEKSTIELNKTLLLYTIAGAALLIIIVVFVLRKIMKKKLPKKRK